MKRKLPSERGKQLPLLTGTHMEHLLKSMHGLMKCTFASQQSQILEQLEQPTKAVQLEHFQFQEDRYGNKLKMKAKF